MNNDKTFGVEHFHCFIFCVQRYLPFGTKHRQKQEMVLLLSGTFAPVGLLLIYICTSIPNHHFPALLQTVWQLNNTCLQTIAKTKTDRFLVKCSKYLSLPSQKKNCVRGSSVCNSPVHSIIDHHANIWVCLNVPPYCWKMLGYWLVLWISSMPLLAKEQPWGNQPIANRWSPLFRVATGLHDLKLNCWLFWFLYDFV